MLGWNSRGREDGPPEVITEARTQNVSDSDREHSVVDHDDEINWFNGNGLAQEPPPPSTKQD